MEALQPALQPFAWASESIPLPVFVQAIISFVLISTIYSFVTRERPIPGFPLVQPEKFKWFPSLGWILTGKSMMFKGIREHKQGFQVVTGTGHKIVLPNRYADEVRNHPDLNFPKAFTKDLFVDYPGFDAHAQGLKDGTFIQEVVRVKLTQSLNLVTADLLDETTASYRELLGDDQEWHTVAIKPILVDIVARLSSRVFLGRNLARNQRWLEIAKTYTTDSFLAAMELRMFPSFTRPIVHWFLPRMRRLRTAVRDAHELITPEVQLRIDRVNKAREAGVKPPKTSDTIGWMYEIATKSNKEVNYVNGQLSLSMAAIHTTSESMTAAILDLAEHPECVQPLREEVIRVISEDGWAKTSLYKMKLMDSFLKESQRVNVMSWSSMNRYVERDITLSDGTLLPAGTRIQVAADTYRDANLYSDPESFQLDRFLKLRSQAGQENNWQFVTTSPNYMLFGHGQHACPGRFFASNELKIALAHFLLKYDVKLKEGEGRPLPMLFESNMMANSQSEVMVRRRKEEINLDDTVEHEG